MLTGYVPFVHLWHSPIDLVVQFKIDEAGLLSGTVEKGRWAAAQMISNNNSWTTTIPPQVPSGHYLIRFETIALHSQPAVSPPIKANLSTEGLKRDIAILP